MVWHGHVLELRAARRTGRRAWLALGVSMLLAAGGVRGWAQSPSAAPAVGAPADAAPATSQTATQTPASQPAPVAIPDLAAWGIEYHFEARTQPRPLRIHVIRADLDRGRVAPRTVIADDPDSAGLAEAQLESPLAMMRRTDALVLVNANAFAAAQTSAQRRLVKWSGGLPVDILGLAAREREWRSGPQPGYDAVWGDAAGRWHIGSAAVTDAPVDGAAGFAQIAHAGTAGGELITTDDGPRHPRTAVGLDASGRKMTLAVIDGRQKGFSEGVTLVELGRIMLELGCADVLNLDGGGSSILLMREPGGEPRIINSPSDRRAGLVYYRPIPVALSLSPLPEGETARDLTPSRN